MAARRRRGRGNFEEDEDDFDLKGEMESGLVIGDTRGGRYAVSFDGRYLSTHDDFDAALKAGVQKMHDTKYFPNVFYVNERGNTDLLQIKAKVIKGKVIKVTHKTLRDWV